MRAADPPLVLGGLVQLSTILALDFSIAQRVQDRIVSLRRVAPAACLVVALVSAEARAGCCNVRKIDTELPTVSVRVCEADAAGACGTLLFEGQLSVGGVANVCTVEETVVYQERPVSGGDYGAPVSAVCDGAEVEI